MDENFSDNETLIARVRQLEHERDELQKDIEQLCMQQAGPGYLTVATQMHFRRTAGLEQEIENLKKKLAGCTRENLNLQEELSEAFRVKSQLADLHSAEVSMRIEVEKQVKFFQGCVAAAFAERDHSVMEAEKAKEKEEFMSKKFSDYQKRVEELASDLLEEKKLTDQLQNDLEEQKKLNQTFKGVVNKFFEIRQYAVKGYLEDNGWEDKCASLLHDSAEMWSFNDHGETSTSTYIIRKYLGNFHADQAYDLLFFWKSALEEEVDMLRRSVDNHENKLRMGLEIENHLKKKIHELEKSKLLSEEVLRKRISGLLHCHSQHRDHVVRSLDEGYSNLKSTIDMVEEKMRQFDVSKKHNFNTKKDVHLDEIEGRDVHVNTDAGSDLIDKMNDLDSANITALGIGDASGALAQALQEKVATLLLLSQQEERNLLDRNVNAALQRKIEELQRNLLQVTNEKVKALMELAETKKEYHQLQEKINHEMKQGKLSADIVEKTVVQGRDGRLKNLLKKTYLKHWVGTPDTDSDAAKAELNFDGSVRNSSIYNMDFARMRIENATLRENLESMEHLTTSVRRLRFSLMKVYESLISEGSVASMSLTLDDIVTEANLVKTALGSCLPVSWSADAAGRSTGGSIREDTVGLSGGDSSNEKVDFVSAAGFETVEIIILAAQILKDHIRYRGCRGGG